MNPPPVLVPAAPVIGSLFGGLDMGVLAALGGGRLAWCADNDPHAATVLAARLPSVPNVGDIRAVDFAQLEPVDVLTAGWPCQDISAAGKRAGIQKGTRSGLFTEVVRALRQLPRPPRLVVLENVAALRWKNGGLAHVLGQLAETGFDAVWRSIRAADIGAPHRRERVFILGWDRALAAGAADAPGPRREQPRPGRPRLAACPGPSGEPARRGRRCHPHAAHPNRGRLPLCGDPDRAPTGTISPGGLHHADRRLPAPAHPDRLGRQQQHPPHAERRAVAHRRRPADAHPARERRDEGKPGPTRLQGRIDAALGRAAAAADPDERGRDRWAPQPVRQPPHGVAAARDRQPDVDWGPYRAAIAQWEDLLGRPAPRPTEPGRTGRPVLSGRFVEFLMGLPEGYISDLELPRTAQLRILGNGVVPQQAAHAVERLLADHTALTAPATGAWGWAA